MTFKHVPVHDGSLAIVGNVTGREGGGGRTLSDAPFMTSPTEKRAIVERRRFRALMKSLKDGLDEIR